MVEDKPPAKYPYILVCGSPRGTAIHVVPCDIDQLRLEFAELPNPVRTIEYWLALVEVGDYLEVGNRLIVRAGNGSRIVQEMQPVYQIYYDTNKRKKEQ